MPLGPKTAWHIFCDFSLTKAIFFLEKIWRRNGDRKSNTTLLQISCEFVINSIVILINNKGPDDTTHEDLFPGMKGLRTAYKCPITNDG